MSAMRSREEGSSVSKSVTRKIPGASVTLAWEYRPEWTDLDHTKRNEIRDAMDRCVDLIQAAAQDVREHEQDVTCQHPWDAVNGDSDGKVWCESCGQVLRRVVLRDA